MIVDIVRKGVVVGNQMIDSSAIKTHETHLKLYDAIELLIDSEEQALINSTNPIIKRNMRRLNRAQGQLIDIESHPRWLAIVSELLSDGNILTQARLNTIQKGKVL